MKFANFVRSMLEEDEDSHLEVISTDETNFCKDAQVNLHNAQYWSLGNPRCLRQAHFQKGQLICGLVFLMEQWQGLTSLTEV